MATPIEIQQQVPLAPCTTLRIGGPARFFTRVTNEAQLIEAVTFARANSLPLFLLGGGSNLLVSDAGFPGLVIHAALDGAIMVDGLRDDMPQRRTVTYEVPAGMDWDAFVRMTCEARFTGIECLAGIPGLVGGSPIQNIGAYGQEVAQTITAVRVLDLESLTLQTLSAAECHFAYRTSIFNTTHRNRFVVTCVTFRFHLDTTPTLTYADLKKHFASNPTPLTPLAIYEAVREIRRNKGMLLVEDDPDCRSAGSFFKNPIVPATLLDQIAATLAIDPATIPHWSAPEPAGQGSDAFIKLPAAWLIEQAGFHKGFALGPAGISSRHTLALINRTGTATCADLLRLRDTITAEVAARFAIHLEQEPVFLQ